MKKRYQHSGEKNNPRFGLPTDLNDKIYELTDYCEENHIRYDLSFQYDPTYPTKL